MASSAASPAIKIATSCGIEMIWMVPAMINALPFTILEIADIHA